MKNQRPHIVFESNTLELGRPGSSAAMIFDFLKRFGYRHYRIHETKRFMRMGNLPQEARVSDYLATRLGPWSLRRRTGKRVETLRSRHIVRTLLRMSAPEWADHLHVLAVAEFLPAGVLRDERVAALISTWRERYRGHPMLEVILRGQFHNPAQSPAPE